MALRLLILFLFAVSAARADLAGAVSAWGNTNFIASLGDSIPMGWVDGTSAGYFSRIYNGGPPSGNIEADVLHRLQVNSGISSMLFTNIGRGAWNWNQVASGALSWAQASGAKYWFIHCGINDIVNDGRTWSQCVVDMNTILAGANSVGARIILDEIFPHTWGDDTIAQTIRTFNTNYASWASTNGVYLLQSHDLMGTVRVSTGFKDDLNSGYASSSPHLTTTGDDYWSTLLLSTLNTIEPPQSAASRITGRTALSGRASIR